MLKLHNNEIKRRKKSRPGVRAALPTKTQQRGRLALGSPEFLQGSNFKIGN